MPAMAERATIVLTGANGMLASAVKRSLSRRGLTSINLDRAECDLTQPDAVNAMMEKHRPSLVLNCAAYTAVDRAEQERELADAVNGHAVSHLAKASKSLGAKLVHISTDFVFDGSATEPYAVDHPCNPVSAYGASKRLGETLLAEVDPPGWLLLRTAWLYGPGGNCFPRTMVTLARQGKPLKVVSDQQGSPTFTFDLAEAMMDLVTANATGTFHVTNAGRTTWFDFTRKTLEIFGASTDLSPIKAADWAMAKPDAAKRPSFSVLDLSRAEQTLHRPMRPWDVALADYYAVTAGQP